MLPSSGRFGVTAPDHAAGLAVPVSGIAGDQQAALFGQACFTPGMTKNTYGTGSFVLTNVGAQLPEPVEGLLTTAAWIADGTFHYAMEGAIFVTGAAIQWLRDGLGVIEHAAETGPLAASVPSTDGVYLVPAFTGLGSPWWDPYARGTVVGITRGRPAAHIARAVVEAMAYQTARRDRRDHRRHCYRVGRTPRRRRCLGNGSPLPAPSRSVRRDRAPRRGAGDHRARRGVPRRASPRASGRHPLTLQAHGAPTHRSRRSKTARWATRSTPTGGAAVERSKGWATD